MQRDPRRPFARVYVDVEHQALLFGLGPRFRGFRSARFLYSASRRRISDFGTDSTLSTTRVKASNSDEVVFSVSCFIGFALSHPSTGNRSASVMESSSARRRTTFRIRS